LKLRQFEKEKKNNRVTLHFQSLNLFDPDSPDKTILKGPRKPGQKIKSTKMHLNYLKRKPFGASFFGRFQ